MSQKKQVKGTQKQAPKPKEPALPTFRPNMLYAAICALVGFCLYVNTAKHEYVLDDVGAITGNEYVTEGVSGIPKIVSVGMWHFDNVNLGYYRPLSMITFAIENELFPGNPHVSHLGNVILYALSGFFLCLLLMQLFRNYNPIFSLIATLLFLAHPIHTEVVANIKSRDEILAFLGMVAGLFFLLKYYSSENKQLSLPQTIILTAGYAILSFVVFKLFAISESETKFWNGLGAFGVITIAIFFAIPKARFLLLALLSFYLALISKESAMTALLIAPLAIYFFSNMNIGKSLLMGAVPILILIILFQVHKLQVLGSLEAQIPRDIVNYPYEDADTKTSNMFVIFLHCIRMIFLPHPLSYDYSYNEIPAVKGLDLTVIGGFLLAIALAYFSLKGLLKKSPLALGVLLFCATLAPAMAFVMLRGGIFAERFLYAPTLGFCIVIVWLIGTKINFSYFKFEKTPNYLVPIGAYGLLFLLYSFKTVTRNPVWHDNFSLFSTDVKASPNSCQVRRHLGSELINLGIASKDQKEKDEWFNKGTAELKEALRINPRFGDAYFKLGVAYQTVRPINDSAIYYYTRAIQEAPGYAISYNNMGILYEGLGKQQLASYYYNKAVDVNPYFPDGLKNRDNHRKKTGLDVRMFPTSTNVDSLERATPENMRTYQFYYKLGTDYASRGDYANAARCLERATQLNPTFVDALVNLANCYGMLKNYPKNIEVLNKVVALYPNNTQAIGNLAVTYELMGNKDKAEEYRDKVRELTGQ